MTRVMLQEIAIPPGVLPQEIPYPQKGQIIYIPEGGECPGGETKIISAETKIFHKNDADARHDVIVYTEACSDIGFLWEPLYRQQKALRAQFANKK